MHSNPGKVRRGWRGGTLRGAFSSYLRGLKLVPSKWRYFVPPTSPHQGATQRVTPAVRLHKIENVIKPTLEIRLRLREQPQRRTPVMYETWHDLLFLHWEYDPQAIQRTLPNGLYVDTFEDKAYLGVIPFFMRGVRPRLFPPIPGLSDFQELNVRTYVYDSHGTPGIWFYSLDANQYLAVKTARLLFNLPYFYANMTSEVNPDNKEVSYSSHRYRTDSNLKTYFRYRPISDVSLARPDTLEFFLIERYILFAYSNNKLYSGRVWHNPYPLTEVEVSNLDENVLCLDGFSKLSKNPDHKIMSSGVEVHIFGLEELNQGNIVGLRA